MAQQRSAQRAIHDLSELKIVKELARGTQSIVYHVSLQGRDYAMKMPLSPDPEQIDQALIAYKREAAILSRVSHPSLLRIFDVGIRDSKPYLIMELIQGKSLAKLLEQESRLSESQTLEMSHSLAAALFEVHRLGQVHRDIKPENIFIDEEGLPKLIDFGFTDRIETGTKSTEVTGTLRYAAPEQIGMLNRPTDGRSDLYALGGVLYECLTGRPPFVTSDPADLARKHAHEIVKPAHHLLSTISLETSALISRLLAKDPDDRFPDAEALFSELVRILPPKGGDTAIPSRRATVHGRESELRQLRAVFLESQLGSAKLAHISGEPGQGKSSLAFEIGKEAQERGCMVLAGKCSEDNTTPYAPIREALEQFFRNLETMQDRTAIESSIKSNLEGAQSALRGFLPRLDAILDTAPHQEMKEPSAELFQEGLTDLVRAVTPENSGIYLFVDDIQWCDFSTQQFLARLLDRASSSRFCLVLASRARSDDRDTVNKIFKMLIKQPDASIELGPVSASGGLSLLKMALGEQCKIDSGFAAEITSRANGNPLAIQEYLSAVLEAGLLWPSWGNWLVDETGLEHLQLPSDILLLIIKRIQLLSDDTRRVLQTAAVMSLSFKIDLLIQVEEAEEAQILDAVSEALLQRLITLSKKGVYTFVHDRIRDGLIAEIPKSKLHHIHHSIARAMDQSSSLEDEESIFNLARHYSQGRNSDNLQRVAETNFEAGRKSCERFAYRDALSFYQIAEAALNEGGFPRNAQLEIEYAETCAKLVELDEAEKRFNLVLDIVTDSRDKALIHANLAEVYLTKLDLDPALNQVLLGMKCLGSALPRHMPMRLIATVWIWCSSQIADWTGIYRRREPSQLEDTETIKLHCRLCERGAMIAYFRMEEFRLIEFISRSMLASERLGPSSQLAVAWALYSAMLSLVGMLRLSDVYATRAFRMATESRDRSMIAQIEILYGLNRALLGKTRTTEQVLQECYYKHKRWMDPMDYLNLCGTMIWCLYLRGYVKEAEVWIHRGLEKWEESSIGSGKKLSQAFHVCAMTTRATLGAPAEAAEHLRKEGWSSLDEIKTRGPNPFGVPYRTADSIGYLVHYFLEQREFGQNLKMCIDLFESRGTPPGSQDVFLRQFYIGLGYIRLEQLKSSTFENRKDSDEELVRALGMLRKAAKGVTIVEAHYRVIRAAYFRIGGHVAKALDELQLAERLGRDEDAPWVLFEAARERAHAFRESRNDRSASREFLSAVALAQEHGWTNRLNALTKEFPELSVHAKSLSTRASSHWASSTYSTSPAKNVRDPVSTHKMRRHLDSILQLSQASVGVLDPAHQARIALDEVVHLLGADRAYLFLKDSSGRPILSSGRNREREDLTELKGYSASIVEKVLASGDTTLFSGSSESGEIRASESIIAHDLRSIMAAPIRLRGEIIGAMYADSKVARGIFVKDDVEILVSLGSQIAFSLETARIAQMEIAQREMMKDLELTGAVQTLLLPKRSEFDNGCVALAGAYHPAAQSGGDWWWYTERTDGSILILLCDVTGHGAGSAMMTAAVAAMFSVLQSDGGDQDVPLLLDKLNRYFYQLCGGSYTMTMSAVAVGTPNGGINWWNAGGSSLYVQRASGELQALVASGAALGYPQLEIGELRSEFHPGDRILIFTDGLYGFKGKDGRVFRRKDLQNLFGTLAGQNLLDARQILFETLVLRNGSPNFEDDVSFVIVERRKLEE